MQIYKQKNNWAIFSVSGVLFIHIKSLKVMFEFVRMRSIDFQDLNLW